MKFLQKIIFLVLLLLIVCEARAEEATSDFFSLCKVTLPKGAESLAICESIQQKFFKNNKTVDMVRITPAMVNASTSALDNKIQFFVFNDPNYLAGIAYCYFVFRNWISPKEIGPDLLGKSASGFSILNEKINEYQNWLLTAVEGKKCQALVEKEAGVSVANLEKSLKGQVALIGINPYASILTPGVTLGSVLKDMTLTINHERIHAYQVACPVFDKWSLKEWEKLPSAKKNEYVKKYSSYNWSIPQIAAREYIGFLYESTPEKIDEHVKNCKF